MKLIKSFTIYALAMTAVTFAATSCSDDEWTPGPAADPDSAGIYFPAQAAYSYTISADDSRIIPITVNRLNPEKAVSVPVVATVTGSGIELPQTIEFAAGERSAILDIDCSGMETKTSGSVSISFPDGYASSYGAGTESISVDITVTGGWMMLAEDIDVSFDAKYSSIKGNLLMLEGTKTFRLANFLNSGLNLDFNVSSETSSKAELIPLTNSISYVDVYPEYDDEYDTWILYDRANSTFPQWSPDGSELQITEAQVLNTGYTYFGINAGYRTFTLWASFSDGTSSYLYVDMNFTPLFNPFEN